MLSRVFHAALSQGMGETVNIGLRRSGEMTLLCSPKVTQHHQQAGRRRCCTTRPIMSCANITAARMTDSHTSPFDEACDRSGLHRGRSRRALAQMMETQTARCEWMISLAPSCPRGNLFLVWVTLNEQKWISFAERRGARGASFVPPPG